MSIGRSRAGALWRLVRATGHVLHGLWVIRSEFGRLTPAQTQFMVREWTRQMLGILGVELVVQGTPPTHGPLLQVANHISWLDILVMNAAQPSRFVSKADVRHWPVIRGLADAAGTLYIERESRRDAMRVVHQVAERLRTPDVISVFPEGTTGDGQTLLTFHANLLQAAIAAGAPALPVALRYADRDSGQRCDAPLYIGDTTLMQSLWATLRADGVQAVVRYGEPQRDQGRDRRTWAQDLRTEVARLLQPDPTD
ncbi:lysophospholipid acyltransferase family protein [Hydrogenophaga sp. SL48]|uniref:lysophospholipid acyltransferase family protein n=1 Tax=Hydrogenophaga sp. SL48 TaxID=2806347 RepID=UPI001F1ED37F|nr:lysophospholipid acyltransferase family protein [Hydrogenophaga sp. SL48]